MSDATDLFFKPRTIEIQGRLEFCDIPPERVVAFPVEAADFDGINLHFNGSESVLCVDPLTCPLHALGNPVRPYFYAPAYVYGWGTKRWTRFVLPIGNEVALFARQELRGRAWKLKPRCNKMNRKKGLILEPYDISDLVKADIAKLEPFDVKSRILQRYNL